MTPCTLNIKQILHLTSSNPRFQQWRIHEAGNNPEKARIPQDIRQIAAEMII